MFYGISHIDVAVTNLALAEKLWRDTIGMEERDRGEGYVDLESGSVVIRLIQVSRTEHPVSLRLQTSNVEDAYETLLRFGAGRVQAPTRIGNQEIMAAVADRDGHNIILWRALTEDEYDFVPELPKAGEWQADAELLLKNLLSHVPALFRALARRKITPYVELLAQQENTAVNREHVIRGYILCTAKPMRGRLHDSLRKQGIDPANYQAEFDDEGEESNT